MVRWPNWTVIAIVRRSFAWLGCCRHLTGDVAATFSSFRVWLMIAHIRGVLRKITMLWDGQAGLVLGGSRSLFFFLGKETSIWAFYQA